jgi:hypothetical protein
MNRLLIYPLLCTLIISCNNEISQYTEIENYEVAEIVSTGFQTEYLDNPTEPFEVGGMKMDVNKVLLINNIDDFDSIIINNKLKMLQSVDWENQTLVGFYSTFMVSSQFLEFKYKVLRDEESGNYLIRINCISYKGTTSLEGLSANMHWFIIPKVSKPSLVDFEIVKQNGKLEDFDISFLFNEYQGLLNSCDKDNYVTEENIDLRIEPITEKTPNIMFSYGESENPMVFCGLSITKFENRIEICGAEPSFGPPLLNTDYKLVNAKYQINSKDLFVDFWKPIETITMKFSGKQK